jgi:twitching motility two-component system response regulator PilG
LQSPDSWNLRFGGVKINSRRLSIRARVKAIEELEITSVSLIKLLVLHEIATIISGCLVSLFQAKLVGEDVNEKSQNEENPLSQAALNAKVMVIDDSRTIRRSAETLLKKAGCEVVTAIDGFEALAKITIHKPDIIFVDIMMPRLDGYQTCALIKNNQSFKATPVIMLSSKDSIFDRARGRIVGSDKYLTKPFSREDLINAINTHVVRT